MMIRRFFLLCTVLCAGGTLCLLTSCGGGMTSASSSGSSNSSTNAYAAVYKSMTWASGVTVSFPSSCTMTVSASGTPPSHNAYYLAPAANGQTVVATTPSGMQLALTPYSGGISTVKAISATFNICPSKANSTTSTSGGAIGLIGSGEALFNAYEATGTVALSDNASYTFTSGGVSYTAYFIDPCNSHSTGNMGGNGSTWHYHGNPVCWTSTVDGNGPSHIIGIALDGFPIYGGRDINGNLVTASQLDACNGITSATPEFPNGAYHYVLPIGDTTKASSLGCYAGSVSATLSAQMRKLNCMMPGMVMGGGMIQPDGSWKKLPRGSRELLPGRDQMQMVAKSRRMVMPDGSVMTMDSM